MTTLAAWVDAPAHVFPDHPESPARLDVLAARREHLPVEWLNFSPAIDEEIMRVHHPDVISYLEYACAQSPVILEPAPTYVTPQSVDAARQAAGAALACTRAVWRGEAESAFAIVRPPGHHAEPGRSMGFCLFNNIAIAAKDALAQGVQRVAVIDFDAHHGNGTESAFWGDPRLAFLSTHQRAIYPGTGMLNDAEPSGGRMVNVPLPPRAGDAVFEQVAARVMRPFVEKFRPGLLLVSAGYDSHWNDPLTRLGLSSGGFYQLSKQLKALADEFCSGKIVFVLEGGYDPHNIANGVEASLGALRGGGWVSRGDESPHAEPDVAALIQQIRNFHSF